MLLVAKRKAIICDFSFADTDKLAASTPSDQSPGTATGQMSEDEMRRRKELNAKELYRRILLKEARERGPPPNLASQAQSRCHNRAAGQGSRAHSSSVPESLAGTSRPGPVGIG